MPKFLVDEDLPRSLTRELVGVGIESVHAIDVGLRGRPDSEIAEYARQKGYVLLSRDMGFSS
jgi:predicted nuclease of predicted toxin-antitoxin system